MDTLQFCSSMFSFRHIINIAVYWQNVGIEIECSVMCAPQPSNQHTQGETDCINLLFMAHFVTVSWN